MRELQKAIDKLIEDKYQTLKRECSTYQELKKKIEKEVKDFVYDNRAEDRVYIHSKLMEKFRNEVGELPIR